MSSLVPIFNPRALRLIAEAGIVFITCACAPQSNIREQIRIPDPVANANLLLNRGDYRSAAEAFAKLSRRNNGSKASQFKAIAALAYQEILDFEKADTLLDEISSDVGQISPTATLVTARSMLHLNAPTDAYNIAEAIDEAALDNYQRGVRARVMGTAAVATNNAAAAADAWVSTHRFPYPVDQKAVLLRETWRAVSRLSESELLLRSSTENTADRGWYSLALITSRSLFDRAKFRQELEVWERRYGRHPANRLTQELVARAGILPIRPRQIALFLPFHDNQLDAASKVIRDGFIAAWFADPYVELRPKLKLYSSTTNDIVTTYERAIHEGADLIVGPLKKNLIETLRNEAVFKVGLLALNVIAPDSTSTETSPFLFQFGLPPEDEANQVARQAYSNGKRAVIIALGNSWGKRVVNAYTNTWKQLGGTILGTAWYGEESQTYPKAVKRALNIDLSEARAIALDRRLPIDIYVEPRRRADIDVILLAGFSHNARQILPQLRYFRADDIPIYATSHVYDGDVNVERDRDLNGLIFGTMPWLFNAVDVGVFESIRHGWAIGNASRGRLHELGLNPYLLYGLGIDAYRLIPHLAKMRYKRDLKIHGGTGVLQISYEGVVHREMSWLKFVRGQPKSIDQPGGPHVH